MKKAVTGMLAESGAPAWEQETAGPNENQGDSTVNENQRKAHEGIRRLEEGLPRWVRSMMLPGKPFGRCKFHRRQKQEWLLYASQQMYSLVVNTGVIEKLHEEEKREWLDLLLSLQDPESGLFKCPVVPNRGDEYFRAITMKLIRRLRSQGIRPRYPPPRAEEKCPTLETLVARMEALPVDEHPYAACSPIGAWAMVRVQELEEKGEPFADDPYLQTICEWLEARQNPETGFWSKSTDLVDSMNGFFKSLPVYEMTGRGIPRMEKIVDSVLLIQSKGGLFGQTCSPWNNMHLLTVLSQRLGHGYRPGDVAAAALEIIPEVWRLKQPDGFYSATEQGCLVEHAGVKLCDRPYPIGDIQGNAHAWDILRMASELLEGTESSHSPT